MAESTLPATSRVPETAPSAPAGTADGPVRYTPQIILTMAFMALAIVAGGFAPVAPGPWPDWLKAAAAVFTGLAGLFVHPPGVRKP